MYQSLLGALQWAVSLGRLDVNTAVMTMASFRVEPNNQSSNSRINDSILILVNHVKDVHVMALIMPAEKLSTIEDYLAKN